MTTIALVVQEYYDRASRLHPDTCYEILPCLWLGRAFESRKEVENTQLNTRRLKRYHRDALARDRSQAASTV